MGIVKEGGEFSLIAADQMHRELNALSPLGEAFWVPIPACYQALVGRGHQAGFHTKLLQEMNSILRWAPRQQFTGDSSPGIARHRRSCPLRLRW